MALAKRWLGRFLSIVCKLHVTILEICHGVGIQAKVFPGEAFPAEGTGASRKAAQARTAPDPDLGSGRRCAGIPVGCA